MSRAAVALVLSLLSCGHAEPETDAARPGAAETAPPAAVTFAPALGVDLAAMTRLDDGVYIHDVTNGSGAAVDSGSVVTVHYRAWLPDGRLFEERPSSDGFGASEFTIGENAPVPGLDSGLKGMRSGGVRRIVVPPELGYDLIGRPAGVPADATLVFEVTLRRVAS